MMNARLNLLNLKSEKLKNLPNNFGNALMRTLSLRKTAMRNPELKQTLVGTFKELIDEQWIEPVDVDCDQPGWYLPSFVIKTTKPRVVYDGSAVFDGMSLNQVVLAGENLLNNLVELLIRFRLGKFACVADLSKCFFLVKIPPDQRDLFRLIWFKDSKMLSDDVQVYRFTRHVWGINSCPFVALLAMKRLIDENPTKACEAMLQAVLNKRYMDDVLFASSSFEDLRLTASKGNELFGSRGFKLRKWVANCHSVQILQNAPHCDLATSLTNVDIGSEPLPNSKTLGLAWALQNDILRVNCKEFSKATTRREMASQFDPLGQHGPRLLASGATILFLYWSRAGLGTWYFKSNDDIGTNTLPKKYRRYR